LSDFVHLHCHSDYSLLDGASSIKGLLAQAQKQGMTHLALTDHGNMFGTLKFYKEARKAGIVPVIGSEFYKAPGSRLDKSGSEKGTRHNHLILLARNESGYRNLMALSSRSYTEGFYYKPRVDDELLSTYREGLICLSACLSGDIPSALLDGRREEAKKRAQFYRDLYGSDGFYLELQDHGLPEQKRLNPLLIELSRETGIPLVVTNDTHYTAREDARAQDILICIGTNKKLSETGRMKFSSDEFWLKPGSDMERLFPELPEAVRNTKAIAERCAFDLPLPGPKFPVYEVPDGKDPHGFLTELAHNGLADRYPTVTDEIRRRCDYELSTIRTMGFTTYFLIVWDFIHFAKSHGICVGPGRGSGAGSLVAYCLKITDIDPLKYNLLFERFLNPERVSLPDFDIDFGHRRREEVIQYVTKKYGEDKVGQVITFGTLKAKAVIRDVARVLDVPYEEADAIAKLVPEGPKVTLADAIKETPKLEEVKRKGDVYRDLIEMSLKLEGLHRHASLHAAGVIIGHERLDTYVPLYRDPKTGSVSSQYTMEYLEECGLVKMDFLGLRTLTVIDDTLNLIRGRGVDISLRSIPEDDPATFRMFGEGKSTGAFQFESSGMQGILKRIKPDRIEELIALNALYRPGSMDHIDEFVDAKLGRVPIKYPLPALEPVLKETYGVPVYQEQVMQIAQVVAGFTLGQADILRRAMGKKKPEEMAKMKVKFAEGAKAKGYDQKTADRIFELLEPFAGYGFNKSHAAAYAVPAYHTIYFKANYPAEFLAANLTNDVHDTDRIAELIREARGMGIEILPPDVNDSQIEFTVKDGKIVYGLLGIRNAGSAAVESIVKEREAAGPFRSVLDFFQRVDLHMVNRKVAEALILTGSFSRMGETRSTLMHNLPRLLDASARYQESRRYGQASLFDEAPGAVEPGIELERLTEWDAAELLKNEKEILGFFFSGHPLDGVKTLIDRTTNLDLARKEEAVHDRSCNLIGMVQEVREIRTRTGRPMAFAKLEDFRGMIELVVFSDAFEKKSQFLAVGRIVGVQGKIDTGRGEVKLKVDDMMEPKELADKAARAIHIRFGEDVGTEESLHQMMELFLESKGRCEVLFHVGGGDAAPETVVRATTQLQISESDAVLDRLREYPQVVDVWKE